MGIFGGIERGVERTLGGKPPEIAQDEVARLDDELEPGFAGGVWEYRAYAVKLDAGGQEVGERRWLERQLFSDLTYAEAWCAWVNARGALPEPSYPTGAV